MAKLVLASAARDDMHDIGDYIRDELQNPGAALHMIQRFRKTIEPLRDYPEMGTLLPNTLNLSTQYRYVICGNYLIFYHTEDDTVYVDRVIYARRDYMALLFGDQLDDDE